MALKGSPDRKESRSSRRRTKWLRRLLVLGLLLGTLSTAGIFYGKPLYRKWRVMQARGMVKEARPFLDSEQWEKASALLGQAYTNAPKDAVVLRGILDLVKKTSSDAERQLYFSRQIIASSESTAADRSGMGQILVALGKAGEAREILEAMSPQERQGRYGLELESNIAKAEGRQDAALELLRRACQQDPDDPECRLRLAMMDLRSPFKEMQDKASAEAWEVAKGHDSHALVALEVLAGSPRISSDQVAELLQLLEAHPAKNDRRRYVLLNALIRVNPLERETILERESTRMAGRSLDESLDYFRWMVDAGGYERVLQRLTRDDAMLRRELLPVYQEALAAAGKWEELRNVLNDSPAGAVRPADEAYLKTRLAIGMGETPAQIQGNVREATRRAAATRDLRNLVRCSVLAENLGYDDIAVEGFRAAASNPQYQAEMLAKVLAIQERQKDPAAILVTTERVLESMPESREHWAMVIYLRLLMGREIELAIDRSFELSKEEKLTPNASRFIEAFSAYRLNDLDRMRGLITQVEADALPAGQRAVLAGLYAAAGEVSRGYIIAEKIAASLLNTQEQVFLKRAL